MSYPQLLDMLECMGVSQLEKARSVFALVTPNHAKQLEAVASFLIQNPELARKPSRGSKFGTEDYWQKLARKFTKGRLPRNPKEPSTIPDPLVSVILQEYFGMHKDELAKTVKSHSLAMASENIIGDLLERYIASKLEDYGWVWCSGEVIKKVDFLAASTNNADELIPIQIKNRDNSENSSSSSVRHGTTIVKWFRTFSKSGLTNWDAFPEKISSVKLSEKEFRSFAKRHLRSLND